MHKILKLLILVALMITLFLLTVFADDTTEINSLIENAKALDGKQVTVQGETIGEVMQRGKYCWVNINDSTNAIGIWMKAVDAQQITYYGNYKNLGDTIIVTGIFHRACTEHGGEADIHCNTLRIIEKGSHVTVQIPAVKIIIAIILLLVLFAGCFVVYHIIILKKPSE